jgi:carboxyl-terminal processing protease
MRGLKTPALVLSGVLLASLWQSTRGDKPTDEMLELYGTFVDAVEQVQANYVKPVDRKELLQSALRGMLAELDPHSSFFNDADWRQFQKQIEGSYSGIGVQMDVDRRSGRLMVIAPIVGSPAYKAGILAGDIVVQIDGQPTNDWTRDKAIEMMTGRPGSEVELSVLHPGADTPVTLKIQRAIVELDSVLGDHRKPDDMWDFMLDHDKKIAYIRISNFTQDTTENVKKALDEIEQQGAKVLILDLRDDPGGLLSAAVEVSDLFLEQGTIVSTRGRNTRERTFVAEKEGTFTNIPVVVLINQFSASASEIVAAALQDHKRAAIVGTRSFGKGSVQSILPLDNGETKLRLTVATYWRQSEKNIHRFKDSKSTDDWGVSPDPGLEVTVSDQQYVRRARARQQRDLLSRANQPKPGAEVDPFENDPQLQKAVEVATAKLQEAPKTS